MLDSDHLVVDLVEDLDADLVVVVTLLDVVAGLQNVVVDHLDVVVDHLAVVVGHLNVVVDHLVVVVNHLVVILVEDCSHQVLLTSSTVAVEYSFR